MQGARRDHGLGGLLGEQEQIQGQGGDQGRRGIGRNSDHKHRLQFSDWHAKLEARHVDGSHRKEDGGEPGGDKADKRDVQRIAPRSAG
eukprot:5145920-Heterocapsa_arctica.AAC.1